MNCSTDNSFPWLGLQSYSLPEWNPIPDGSPKPCSVSNSVQSLETTHTISKSAHKIQSTEKTSQYSKKRWTPDEDMQLLDGVKKHGVNRAWRKISIEQFSETKSNIQCRQRFWEYLDPKLYHGPATQEEIRKYLQIEGQVKKDQKGVFRMSDFKKAFNKNLKPGQYRSIVFLKNIQLKLKRYRKKNEIPSLTSTISSASLSEGSLPKGSSVLKKEIDIEAFIRNFKNQPAPSVQVNEEALLIYPSDSNAASSIEWSKEEDTKLIEAVEKYGKKWQNISSFFDRSPGELFRRWPHLKREFVSRKRKSEPEVDREAPTKKQEIFPPEFNMPLLSELPELLEHKEHSSNPLNTTENLQLINTFLTNSQFFLSLISSLQQQGTMGSYGT